MYLIAADWRSRVRWTPKTTQSLLDNCIVEHIFITRCIGGLHPGENCRYSSLFTGYRTLSTEYFPRGIKSREYPSFGSDSSRYTWLISAGLVTHPVRGTTNTGKHNRLQII